MTADLKKTRERIMRRVHALLQKTPANGASEQEAMSAAALAAKLMAEHDLTLIDIKDQTDNKIGALEINMGALHDVRYACSGIEALTGTTYFRCCALMTFFGYERDTSIAIAILGMLRNAMDAEWARYRTSVLYQLERNRHASNSIRSAFMKAMAIRIGRRLHVLAEEKRARMGSAAPSTIIDPETGETIVVAGGSAGTALVVQKQREVDDALRATGLKIKAGRAPNIAAMPTIAKSAGWEAGGKVGLGGIGDNAETPKLGND